METSEEVQMTTEHGAESFHNAQGSKIESVNRNLIGRKRCALIRGLCLEILKGVKV